MKNVRLLVMLIAITFMGMSCTTMTRSMKTPSNHVEFTKDDFELSSQVTGEATESKVLGIDFARLFTKKYGEVSRVGAIDIPIIGNYMNGWVNMYALYNVMNDNPGYDVIFYPSYETKKTGIPILFEQTTVKVKARLGKLEE